MRDAQMAHAMTFTFQPSGIVSLLQVDGMPVGLVRKIEMVADSISGKARLSIEITDHKFTSVGMSGKDYADHVKAALPFADVKLVPLDQSGDSAT